MKKVLILLMLLSVATFANKRVVGYFANWEIYGDANGNNTYDQNDIPYDQLTHIQYAFFIPQTDGTIKSSDTYADKITLPDLVNMAHQHSVKVLFSVGGWTDSKNFPVIAADINKIKIFAHSTKELIKKYNFDGIDIDWEYPGYTDHNGTPQDADNFVTMLSVIRDTLNTFSENKLLTLAIAGTDEHGAGYKVEEFKDDVDFISVMTYDYTGSWDSESWYNSPLYIDNDDSHWSVNKAMQYYVNRGVPKDKLNIGVAFYGASFKDCDGPNEPTHGAGPGEDPGSMSYRMVSEGLENGDYTYHWDDVSKVPYVTTSAGEYCSYDDTTSVRLKGEYVVKQGFGGAIIWELSLDKLTDNSQPLLSTLYSSMNSESTSVNKNKIVSNSSLSIYPNPFNPTTTISFNTNSLKSSIKVYDITGREILSRNFSNIGQKNISFDGSRYSSGIYCVKAISGTNVIAKNMILLK